MLASPWMTRTRRSPQAAFIMALKAVMPGSLCMLWLPTPIEAITNVTSAMVPGVSGRVWTYDGDPSSRVVRSGTGTMITFNGTSNLCAATDTGLPAAATARTFMALIKQTVVNVTDNPIFCYGTALSKQAFLLELVNARIRVAYFASNGDLATSSQAAGRSALVGVSWINGIPTYFNNGRLDGVGNQTASVNTTLGGAGRLVVGDTVQPSTWGLANKGNVTTGFVAGFSAQSTEAIHAQAKIAVNRYFGLSL